MLDDGYTDGPEHVTAECRK